MSIYIPGIAPPENCDKCTHPTCTLWQNREPDGRHEDCPIIEIGSHGRLIDASKLPFAEARLDEYGDWWMDVDDIETAPTIIPADPEGGADNA